MTKFFPFLLFVTGSLIAASTVVNIEDIKPGEPFEYTNDMYSAVVVLLANGKLTINGFTPSDQNHKTMAEQYKILQRQKPRKEVAIREVRPTEPITCKDKNLEAQTSILLCGARLNAENGIYNAPVVRLVGEQVDANNCFVPHTKTASLESITTHALVQKIQITFKDKQDAYKMFHDCTLNMATGNSGRCTITGAQKIAFHFHEQAFQKAN